MPTHRLLLLLSLPACFETAEPADPAPLDSGAPATDGADGADGTDGTGETDGTDGTGGTTVTSGTRGVWAWRDAGDPYGTDAVVGDPVAEAAMVDDLIAWGVDRVYGSYGDRPVTEPAVLAAWNERLHDAGIESHVLMGDPAWTSSREWANMEEKIQDRLLVFNAGQADPDHRFDGLHLDIEPHASSTWSLLDEDGKYDQLFLLDAACAFAADVIAASASPGLPIGIDLPVWYDHLPPSLGSTGQVGWPSVAARDAWYTDLADHVERLSMMAYEADDLAVIQARVADETALFPGEVRVGLNEEVGTTWPTIAAMFTMADDLEGAGRVVDLHSYSAIRAHNP